MLSLSLSVCYNKGLFSYRQILLLHLAEHIIYCPGESHTSTFFLVTTYTNSDITVGSGQYIHSKHYTLHIRRTPHSAHYKDKTREAMPGPEELTELHQKLNLHYPQSYLLAWAQGVRPDWAEFLHKVFTEDVPALLSVGQTGPLSLVESFPSDAGASNLMP